MSVNDWHMIQRILPHNPNATIKDIFNFKTTDCPKCKDYRLFKHLIHAQNRELELTETPQD